ncbi:putative ATPase [Rubellimicrobium thermophilum DSM 16684]|uniref:Putative ATPase n=1 Tax=Rubellimicrobium thermophilum DSM 16684 TaxID=1123069 RepID=S9QUD8_9RHOB|nr:putative ATPase [Rubellimicrobium thermophilum DSM 16684]
MTPSDLYRQRLDRGRLTPDPAQQAVLPILDRLAATLLDPPRKGLLRRPQRVKGLYLWGSVGTGKSMLMDLLLEALGVRIPVRREHFHAFMQWVQAALGRARKAGRRTPSCLWPTRSRPRLASLRSTRCRSRTSPTR